MTYIGANYKNANLDSLATFQTVNRSKYKQVGVYVKNNTNISVRTKIVLKHSTSVGATGDSLVVKDINTLASGAESYIMYDPDPINGSPELRNYLLAGLDVRINATDNASSGSFDVSFFGGDVL